MKKQIITFLQIIFLSIFLFACQTNGEPEESDTKLSSELSNTPKPSNDTFLSSNQEEDTLKLVDIEYSLKSQIKETEDEYLEWYSKDNNYFDILKLDNIQYGSFTAPNKSEIMAIFKVLGAPHAGGLDRTLVAVYDMDTLKIITQKTFASDIVSIYFLDGYQYKIQYILVIGDVTYQGYTTYTAEFFTLRDGNWAEIPLPIESTDQNLAYAVTNNNKLHIFKLDYDEYRPIYDYIETLFFSIGDEKFIRESP